MNYRPIYAAADTDQVIYAGWHDPQNHAYGLGLYVKLRHPNGYSTSYGHMSALAVTTCGAPGCSILAHGEMIGISGNSGNSSGPHLHFRVGNSANRAIDPYGWTGAPGTDPWASNQPESLWIEYPSIEMSWNPVTGCSKVSQGCKFCYAERMALRLRAMGVARYRPQ